ncbi:hypothetical protein LTR37_018992 [Vermiconidia calcicola]|uniref:Uncharacterized protein n=1 Tax=Vermiconidia calcicola TaxID=1690605 RepID=A0ACC3MHB7_9PEZI|nr:hypothetical protein LTR37_018992 [Vermiconidia calcicola]
MPSHGKILILERSLGFKFERGFSRQTSQSGQVPAIRELLEHIDTLNQAFGDVSAKELRKNGLFRDACEEIFLKLGGSLWPPLPAVLVDAKYEDFSGLYPEDLSFHSDKQAKAAQEHPRVRPPPESTAVLGYSPSNRAATSSSSAPAQKRPAPPLPEAGQPANKTAKHVHVLGLQCTEKLSELTLEQGKSTAQRSKAGASSQTPNTPEEAIRSDTSIGHNTSTDRTRMSQRPDSDHSSGLAPFNRDKGKGRMAYDADGPANGPSRPQAGSAASASTSAAQENRPRGDDLGLERSTAIDVDDYQSTMSSETSERAQNTAIPADGDASQNTSKSNVETSAVARPASKSDSTAAMRERSTMPAANIHEGPVSLTVWIKLRHAAGRCIMTLYDDMSVQYAFSLVQKKFVRKLDTKRVRAVSFILTPDVGEEDNDQIDVELDDHATWKALFKLPAVAANADGEGARYHAFIEV